MKVFFLIMIGMSFCLNAYACDCAEEHEDYANWIRNHLIKEGK